MRPILITFIIITWITGEVYGAPYYGKFIGKLSELHHGVSGEVYAVDGRTLYLKDFTYDGQGPAAYFYASTSRNANSAGFRLRDENGSPEVIRRYRKEGVTLTLPEGKTLNNIKIFYVWCEEFEVNFGDVKIPRNFDFPRPQKIDALKGVHAISSDPIVIVDAQTLLVPNLSYDGEAPDAKFWVGRGSKPSPQGIRVPDENGKSVPLRRYDRKTVVLTLPGDLTVFDIGHFGIWCEAFTVDFGHVQIPQNINVPPSLKMLGVSPQSKLNCEVLYDDLAFEVRWAVAGDSIVLQLVAKLDDREYMSFGISGDDSRSEMIGGDVVVAWVDRETLKGYAQDYHLAAKSQCSGPSGSCPDNRLSDNTDNVRLLNAAMVNGYSIVTYQRPLKPSDEFDRQIHTNRSQAIIWAIGPLNQRNEVSFHNHYTKGDQFINFGRPAQWNCPMPEGEQPVMKVTSTTTSKPRNTERRRGGGNNRKEVSDNENSATRNRQTDRRGSTRRGANNNRAVPTPAPVTKREAWDIPPIKCDEPEDGVFYAQMGPTGGKRGYPAITGHVGWGISWYINGLLIPEINVVRGKTYTFVVEGGFDPEVAAKYHPFYITDDPVGGYEYKTPEEKKNITIFAGALVAKDGSVKPTGTGRLCHWTQQGDLEADDFESFGAYQRSLELKCDQGEPGVIQWTPDEDTPDTVYYQCFTHRYLGWKINVHDTCDEQPAASEVHVSVVPAPDLEESPSIRIESRVKPNALIVEDKEDKNNTTVSELKVVSPVTTQPILVPETISPSIYVPVFNPYIYENPFSQLSLKPNLPFNSVREDFKTKNVSSEAPESTLPLSVTTTAATTSTTIISTDRLREKFIIAAPSEIKPINQSLFPPLMFKNNFVMRRPIIKRRPYHPIMVRLPYKKPVYRPVKRPLMEPLYFSDPMKLRGPQNFLVSSQPQIKLYPTPQAVTIQNVEISPLQPSTEKVPDQQMMQSAFQKESVPENYVNSASTNFSPFKTSYVQSIKPAKNTGFRPESVVIEGGFKPIVTKEFQKRISQEPELQYESEIGVIDQKRRPQHFEPMFVPSPIDKIKQKRPIIKKVIIKHPRSVPDDDIATAAAERVESYYLPPLGSQPQISESQQPSNIDLESPKNIDLASPPDVVVTYDGKRVSGASLTAKIADRSSILDQRASKAAELIKARPQFAPFKGELPPLNPEIINKQVPQLQSRGLIRDPETPPRTSTKLRLIRQKRSEKTSSLI